MSLIFTADAGHALTTKGKETPDKIKEWSFNNKVLLSYQKELATYDGVTFYRLDDPTGKTDIPLETRLSKMKSLKSDFHTSFHQNAFLSKWGSHGGTETYVCKAPTKKELELAEVAQKTQLNVLKLRNRGIKKENFYIINNTYKTVNGTKVKIPSILLESGFMDSTTDIIKLKDDKALAELGKQLAISFASYFKLKKKVVVQSANKPITQNAINAKETGVIKVLVDNLNYYDGPRWSKPTGAVKKGTVLTVVGKVMTDGAWQYKLKSGTYITASDKYVKFTAK